jgi:saccharopine dehydrogenase (NAD+, L-lysine-forming)
MAKTLIIGAGGVASVAIHKCCQHSEIFPDICIASRTLSKCDAIKSSCIAKKTKTKISTCTVDANKVDDLVRVMTEYQPDLVMNLALPYQDLPIMDACLKCGVNYLDTANYEPEDTARFEYKYQWAYREKFKHAGLTAILGCGFDPGVTQVWAAYAQKHYFDEIHYIDILDCNGGDHGYPFATNFSPEINIREVSANGRYYQKSPKSKQDPNILATNWNNGDWVETKPMEIKYTRDFAGVGQKDMYLMYHEELESLAKNIKGLKRARFFMTFGQSYLTHLKCLENVGMTAIKPVKFNGMEIVPLQFLSAVLPDPASLGARTKGKTHIGMIFSGTKNGKPVNYYIYQICDHQECFKEVGSQAISYTTGVPAMIGAMLFHRGTWKTPGVYNVEELPPDEFLDEMNKCGLPWAEDFNPQSVE